MGRNQMGVLQSYLFMLSQSQYCTEDADPPRVLRSLWLQPKVMPLPNSTVLFQSRKLQPNDPSVPPSRLPKPSRSYKPYGRHRVILGRCGSKHCCRFGCHGPKNTSASPQPSNRNCSKSLHARSTADSKPEKRSSSGASTDAPSPAHCSKTTFRSKPIPEMSKPQALPKSIRRAPLSCAVSKPGDMGGPLHLGTVQWYDWQSCWLCSLVAPRAEKSTPPKANALTALSVTPCLIFLSTALKKPRNFAVRQALRYSKGAVSHPRRLQRI